MSSSPSDADLTLARREALDAQEEVEASEAQLRRLRRVATSKMRHYEDLLAQRQGQLALNIEEPEHG